MRRLGVALFVSFAICGVSTAWAQYGMYGSPDVLPVQQYPAPVAQPVAWTAPVDQQPALMQPVPAPAPSASSVNPPQGYVPQRQGSGVMNQMLAEQGNGCGGCGGNATCGESACCGPCCDRLWYTSVSALVLNRGPGRRLWTSAVPFPHDDIQLGNTDVPLSCGWGGEVQLGRRFCCDCTPYAIEATFWTTAAFTGSQTSTPMTEYSSTMDSPLLGNFLNLDVGGNTYAVNGILNAFTSNTVTRRDEFYNIELNLIREKMAWCCDSSWEIGWSLGVRYFRFQESLTVGFGTNAIDGILDGDIYFNDYITNNLIGPQIGFDLAYNLGANVRLFINPRFGIYGNYVVSNFDAQGRQTGGQYVEITNTATNQPGYPAHGTTAGVAFLTQVDLGVDWQFTRNWSARAGYRVVAMTGMGLAEDEFPQYLCATGEMQEPQHSGSLVLHGAFFGLTYNF
jgi:hypothetical protein